MGYATVMHMNVTLPQWSLFDLRSYQPLVGVSSSDYVLYNANCVQKNLPYPVYFNEVIMAVNKNSNYFVLIL